MMKAFQDRNIRASILLGLALLVALVATLRFRSQWVEEPLYPSPHLTEVRMLSEYHPPLEGTPLDTELYFFDSGVPGGTLLICGGNHPNEPAGYLASVFFLENIQMTEGRAIVMPRMNKGGFLHTESQEAQLQRFRIPTPHGEREFRHGSRVTSPVLQWPDPTVYVNPRGIFWDEIVQDHPEMTVGNPGPGQQTLAGIDSRNVNRVFPGHPRGTITEQLAYAIVELIRQEEVNLAVDYHEAAPEYPTNNVIVAHERAADVATWAELLLAGDNIGISTDTSAINLRGLTHREWGDADPGVLPVLLEAPNVAQGRLKGRTTEEQIVEGRDLAYERVQMIQTQLNERLAERARRLEERGRTPRERSRRILYVRIPEGGIHIDVRTARHVQTTMRLVESYNDQMAGPPIGVASIPHYDEIVANGTGYYLHGPEGEPPAGSNGEEN